jgi:hypothetical protein
MQAGRAVWLYHFQHILMALWRAADEPGFDFGAWKIEEGRRKRSSPAQGPAQVL